MKRQLFVYMHKFMNIHPWGTRETTIKQRITKCDDDIVVVLVIFFVYVWWLKSEPDLLASTACAFGAIRKKK